MFYADARYALLIVLQGRDASGKDGTIRKVFSAVNPQGCTVSSFKAPTELEQHHDYLWRIHQQVPPRGMIGIFNRSHYEDILVPRVHELVPKKVWSARYDQINDFERMLVRERRRDPQVHAPHLARRAEEAARGAARRRTKNWKFRAGDLDDRKHWDDFTKAYRGILENTSTEMGAVVRRPGRRQGRSRLSRRAHDRRHARRARSSISAGRSGGERSHNRVNPMRHSPGILLCACAFFLALAGCGGADHGRRPVIGVVQVSSLAPLDEAREGFFKALADSGFVRDVNVTFLERNAQGDIPTLSLIMREFLQQGVTQVATISSVATQTAMKVITDRPIVFGAVANPYVISAGTSPTSHRPNVTGAEIPLPSIRRSASARTSVPEGRRVGHALRSGRSVRRVLCRHGEAEGGAARHPVRHGRVHESAGHRPGSPGAARAGRRRNHADPEHHDRRRIPGARQAGARARHAGRRLQHRLSRRAAGARRELLRQRLRAGAR